MATLDSLIGPEGQPNGRRFTREPWLGDGFYFKPVFRTINAIWAGLNQCGYASFYEDEKYDDWQEYFEPPKQVTRWKWAVKGPTGRWFETYGFFTDEEVRRIYANRKYIKLERTAQEFPDE